MDNLGLHGLSCQSSQGRLPRHQVLNNIIHRSLASANISNRLEPSGLYRVDGKSPDEVTHAPWSGGKFLVWDATCVTHSAAPAEVQQLRKQEELQPLLKERRQESTSTLTGRTASSQLQWKPVDQWARSHCVSCMTSAKD